MKYRTMLLLAILTSAGGCGKDAAEKSPAKIAESPNTNRTEVKDGAILLPPPLPPLDVKWVSNETIAPPPAVPGGNSLDPVSLIPDLAPIGTNPRKNLDPKDDKSFVILPAPPTPPALPPLTLPSEVTSKSLPLPPGGTRPD
jgi:hypothetical protein